MKTIREKRVLKFATPLVIAGALFLASCGGSDAPQAPPPEPMATEYEMALEEIQGAATAEAAQMAYDDVDLTAVTGDEAAKLHAALVKRQADLATAARIVEQRAALAMAADAVDTSDLSTREAIEDANNAISALRIALAGATDLSDADKMAAQSKLADAESAVSTATATLDLNDRKMAQSSKLSGAVTALQTELDGFSDIPTASEIAAARAALTALNTAIEEAVDLDDAAKNAARLAKAGAEGRIDTADKARMAEDARIADETRKAVEAAKQRRIDSVVADVQMDIDAAKEAVNGLTATSTDADVEAAEAAIEAAENKINDADIPDANKSMLRADLARQEGALGTKKTAIAEHREQQRKAEEDETRIAGVVQDLKGKIAMANALVNGLSDTSSDEAVRTAQNAVSDAKAAIKAADLPQANKDALTATLDESVLVDKKASRVKAIAAAAATAAKLYAGIAAQNGDVANTTAAGTALGAATERGAAYNNVDVPSSGTAIDTRIMVGIGTATPVALTEDKKTMVGEHHGWEGKRYTAEPDDDGTYEAVVYSNVGEPTMGAKFNSGATELPTVGDLDDTSGETGVLSGLTGYAPLVASPSFDQSAGIKEFKLPTNTVRVMLSGTYYGVAGTYYCTPAANSTCASRKAAEGFELGSTLDTTNAFTAGGWTFKPTNPEARVMSSPDAIYASYGWWIHTAEDGGLTASAFVDVKGALDAAEALNTLQGTATYMGGAAGKYALSSSTGGTNDAGHFTAKATLEADFSDNSITGTINTFMGADGMSRNWSVELKEATIAATGGITRTADNDTVWTIDGNAAAASGEWGGTLYDNDDGGVPKVGTGTFDSMYGQDGKMVGAFGVNKQ